MRTQTVMSLYCEWVGWQGGTIHQAKRDFQEKPMKDKDRFCGILVDRLSEIQDIHHVQDFMRIRLGGTL